MAKPYIRRPIVKAKSKNFSGTVAPGNESTAPVVIGIYGTPGCGKTYLLNSLKHVLDNSKFLFYDGSAHIKSCLRPDGPAFESMTKDEQNLTRHRAIQNIRNECVVQSKAAIVTGHLLFWPEGKDGPDYVYTQTDFETYTHIIHLDVDPTTILQRQLDDNTRKRPKISLQNLNTWQETEKEQLRRRCHDHGVFFASLSGNSISELCIANMIKQFQYHNEEVNTVIAVQSLEFALSQRVHHTNSVLLFDADRTLAPQDSGKLLYGMYEIMSKYSVDGKCPMNHLFGSQWGYSYDAFYQATLLFEEIASKEDFNRMCNEVATKIEIHPEFVNLIQAVKNSMAVVVVSCGLRPIWEKVLQRHGLADALILIAGGRLQHGYVVTPEIKGQLTTHLHDVHKKYIVAFGDSPIDLPMLKTADRAIVVVGDEEQRSRTMDYELRIAIEEMGLRAEQVLLPKHVSPRLDSYILPVLDISGQEFLNSLFQSRIQTGILHATNTYAAKILSTSMRDANMFGPRLRDVHRQVGWFLSHAFVTNIIGIEEYAIPHTQGHMTIGHRLRHENETLIVPLMRGGEPMAFGVSQAFPLAAFLHAKIPDDITEKEIIGMKSVILVDSVVNSGKSIIEIVTRIRTLNSFVQIVVVAGVGQKETVSHGGPVGNALKQWKNVSLVFLRLSQNSYTGQGGTDTGNRLFNTTHLE